MLVRVPAIGVVAGAREGDHRALRDGRVVAHRLNDDGEPGGSAARPMFNVLLAEGLTDVLAVVVRYFGGTKLGVPGLIAAYKAAVQAAVQAAVVIDKTRETAFLLRFPYACLNEVMRRLKAAALQPTDLLREATCTLRVNVPVPEVAAFLNRCREVYELEIIEE